MNCRLRLVPFVLCGPVLVSACGQKDGSIAPETSASGTNVAVDSPRPPPSAEPSSSVTDKAPRPPVPVSVRSDHFKLVLFADKAYTSYRLYAVGDRIVIGPTLQTLEDGRIVDTPRMDEVVLKGEDKNGSSWDKGISEVDLEGVMGSYPDDLWIDVSGMWGMVTARGYADTWVEHRYTYLRQFGTFGRVPDRPVAAAPWSGKRTLAYLGEGRFRLALTNKKKPDPLPVQAAGKEKTPRIDGVAMTALRDGKVALVGPDADRGGALSIERWSGDAESLSRSEIVELPGAPSEKPRAAWIFLNGDRTFVAADFAERAYLAEVDPTGAAEVESPTAHILGAHVAADGTLFVDGGDTLFRYEGRVSGKAEFMPAKAPARDPKARPRGLFAASHDVVYWAVEKTLGHSVIYSTRAAPPPLPSASASASAAPSASAQATPSASVSASSSAQAAPSASVSAAPSGSSSAQAVTSGAALLASFPALTAACTTPLVALFPVASSTPKDFDFAATWADLAGLAGLADVELVEIEHQGERFLAAVVKDEKAAQALVAHLTAKKKDPAPRAVCFAVPANARKIPRPK